MPYLIDGYNLFHAAQSVLPQGFDLARSQLTTWLGSWSAASQEKVTVVWDGVAPPVPLASQIGDSRLFEIYARGQTADERIAKILEIESGVREVVVVSNDREVQRFARHFGAGVESCEIFLKRVARELRRQKSSFTGQEPEEKRRGLEAGDARAWLTAFGFDADGPEEFEHP
jgi:predicted RNA-binding protein with PIN domain